jgi:hypothetical protein
MSIRVSMSMSVSVSMSMSRVVMVGYLMVAYGSKLGQPGGVSQLGFSRNNQPAFIWWMINVYSRAEVKRTG